jgi:hypothetical protein
MPGQRKNPGLLGEEEDRGLKRRMDEGYRPARPYAGRKAASACWLSCASGVGTQEAEQGAHRLWSPLFNACVSSRNQNPLNEARSEDLA